MANMIIGLGFRSGVGKSTLAKALTSDASLKRTRLSFASELKHIAHLMYGWAGLENGPYYDVYYTKKHVKLKYINMTPVEIWIALGTGVARNIITDTWAMMLFHRIKSTYQDHIVIIDDVRFSNEMSMIHQNCGVCINIKRPDNKVVPQGADSYLSDASPWDYTLINDGTPEDLVNKFKALGVLP
jgi:hypothetical protein